MKWRVVGGACIAGAALVALADSTLPQGWTQQTQGALIIYRVPESSTAVEFRLHPPEPRESEFDAWFARRAQTPPEGVDVKSFGTATRGQGKAYMAVHAGKRQADGAGVLILGMGCEAQGGMFRYGELIGPADKQVFADFTEDVTTLMTRACATVSPAAARPRPPSPGRADPPPLVGRGIGSNQLEAILFSWEQRYRATGLQMKENAFLLLKDGTYCAEVPAVPLEEFDATADKAVNPKKWGTWRKEGGDYLLSSAGKNALKPPHQSVKSPARAGERLDGRWVTGSSGSLGTTGYWHFNDVWLSADGRFTTKSHGGAGAGGGEVVAGRAYDDEGSAASVSAPNAGGGAWSSTGKTLADRSGTYKLDGYTMELRFDNGRVVRQLFFANKDRSMIWFAGKELMKEKAK